jgi:eukaryotic-like serine/threonine-protein kinase
MATVDAAALGERAVRIGLITLDQLQEGYEEIGQRGGDPEPLLLALERKRYLTPWQSQKLLKDDPDGYFLGGYRILYKIASGTFGRVYRADDPRSGTVVAIKVLRRKWSDDKHNIELFEREGKMGMSLSHPNVVEIKAVNRDSGTRQYYIVMEFVEGGNLREWLKIRKKIEPPEALRILEDAASGLAYAFSRGLSHRDMKLTNILLSTQGPAKLVDFGLAGVYGRMQELDQTKVDRTVDYAGLEKTSGVPVGDIRSDIFFLGCVAYEILTGRAPLEATRDARARMMKERFASIPPLTPEDVKGPPALFRLVNTMMAINPLQRYQTPSQLLEAIREVRRALDGKSAGNAKKSRTLFVVEKEERLQNVLREKLKEQGYRVLLAADPTRAVERFRTQSFDALVVDAATAGEEGIHIFDRIMEDAIRHDQYCAGILILTPEQKSWQQKLPARTSQAVLIHPVKLKQLLHTLSDLMSRHPG